MSIAVAPEGEQYLESLLSQAHDSQITEGEFISVLKPLRVPINWVESHLHAAYAELDTWKICLLLDCIESPLFGCGTETQGVTAILCQIIEDPRIDGGTVEMIVEVLGYFYLEKSALRSIVNVCTSPRWDKEGWPDLRKALETVGSFYRTGVCSREEVIAAYQEILNSQYTVNEYGGMRDSISGYIKLVEST
jgi:hypothetical protein